MIIRGLKWCSLDGGWGESWSQVEFLDNGKQRFIAVSRFDQEWVIVQSDEDIIDLVTEDEYNPGEHEVIDGEFPGILPDIIRSPYSADISFTIQTLEHFPGFQYEDEWESKAEKYIKGFIGKDSGSLIQTEKEMERENGMKYDVKLFPDDKTVLSVKMEGKEKRLLYRTLAKYNEDITDENIEEASATVCNGLIVGTITAFSGQTGLVYVWNPLTSQIEHVSEGSYAVRAMLVGDKLYSLLYISSWGKQPEFQLCRIEFGVKDPERESEVIPIPENISGCPWPADGEVELDAEDNLIHITIGDKEASV